MKEHLLDHLDAYLEEAELNLRSKEVEVHWALDGGDARRILADLVREHGVRKVVKGKSMLGEELEVNPHLESLGVEVFETDLGEYIIQLLHEPPSHIVGPAIHLGLEEIRKLFHEFRGLSPDATPEEIASEARRILREAFLSADMGITGANFVVAETGTIALIENEGNIRLSTSAPRIHVAFVGIEKLLPRWSDLAGFLQLTPRSATGQRVGNYVSLIEGPRRRGEGDGPEILHVVFVDNGRSKVLADPIARETLRCVRCGSCLNACPVYRQTGGHAYGWVYSGPIGAALAPGLLGLETAWPLPYASSLCGACEEACPVRVPIPKLLLEWRRRAAEGRLTSRGDSWLMRLYAKVMGRPARYRRASRMLERLLPKWSGMVPGIRVWQRGRGALEPSKKSFRDRYEEGIE